MVSNLHATAPMKKALSILSTDGPASIVVLLVALPLCLGIALGSNAPLFSGIIAGVVGGIAVGLLSRSSLSVSGPAAGLTAIVAGALALLPFQAFLVSVVIAGALQFLFGWLRAGVVGDYIPNSVIKGMLAAIGIILVLKQLPHLVGHDPDFEGDETFLQPDAHNTLSALLYSIPDITPLAAVIGVSCLIAMIVLEGTRLKKFPLFKYLPAPLLIVVLGVALEIWLAGPIWQLRAGQHVQLPQASTASEMIALLTFPDLGAVIDPQVWITGITLALVASLETLLSIEAVDKLDPLKRVTPTDRELKAQGVGNMLCGLLGGLPVTSVIVRSSANVNAGGRTRASAVMHGVMLLLCVLLIPNVLNTIPKAALAAILIYTGYKLARVSLFREFYRRGWDQFVPFVVTIAAILFTDLLKGVAVGVVVALFYLVRSNFRTALLLVENEGYYLLRLRTDVSFLNKPGIKRMLESVPEGARLVIDATRATFIDRDVVDEIGDFLQHAHLRRIKVEVRHAPGEMHERLFALLPVGEFVSVRKAEASMTRTH